MKLTTALLVGVFALGSTFALAGGGHGHGKHLGHGHHKHKHSANFSHKLRAHHRGVHQYPQPVVRRHRGDSYETIYARVISAKPVYRYFSEPVRDHSCLQYDRSRRNYSSHTATILGAVIGGAVGHRVGDSHGDPQIAAVAGGLLGASVGRDIDQRASYNRGLRVEGPCRSGNPIENRRELLEYKVTYSYNGQIHYTRMEYDPGEWVKLGVSYTPA